MGRGVRFTVLMYDDPEQVFFSFDELELYNDAVLAMTTFPVLRQEGGVTSRCVPVLSGLFRVRDSLFLIGGLTEQYHPTLNGLDWLNPSNWLWSAPLPSRSPQPPLGGGNSTDSSSSSPDLNFLTWTGCASMCLGRLCPMVVPLYDGKIFICGGFRLAENWVTIYDPKTSKFVYRDAPGNLWMERPNSCFLWWERDRTSNHHHRKKKKKPLVMVYYHHSPLKIHEEAAGEVSFTNLGKDPHPQLFSYDVESDSWETFADNLPAPRPGFLRQDGRNLIYVGGDILFIIDSSSLWFVYDLSVKEMVGKVEVNGLDKDRLVIQALFLGSSYNVDCGSNSMTFCTFSPHECVFHMGYHDIAYAKVRVQLKGGDYVAEVLSKAILKVGVFCDIFVFADQRSRKRAAEEEAAPLGLGEEEDLKKMEL